MTDFIKINDHLAINLNSIYSICSEIDVNSTINFDEIEEWNIRFNDYVEQLKNHPAPPLEISPNVIYQPGISKYSERQEELYYKKFKDLVIEEIGDKPIPVYANIYYLFLTNGTKVNIDKVIYDRLMKEVRE